MKKTLRSLITIFTVTFLTIIFVLPASAATGVEGLAVYRDGVFYGANWHSGIMYDRSVNYSSLPVIHHPGSGYATFGTWNQFMDGNNNFKGVYAPKGGISSAWRDKVKSMAYKLATDQILYTLYGQLEANSFVLDKKYTIEPGDIYRLRCDGVVEYCYEYYGYRVFGNDNYWNISRATQEHWAHHNTLVNINPQWQAEKYMNQVQNYIPW